MILKYFFSFLENKIEIKKLNVNKPTHRNSHIHFSEIHGSWALQWSAQCLTTNQLPHAVRIHTHWYRDKRCLLTLPAETTLPPAGWYRNHPDVRKVQIRVSTFSSKHKNMQQGRELMASLNNRFLFWFVSASIYVSNRNILLTFFVFVQHAADVQSTDFKIKWDCSYPFNLNLWFKSDCFVPFFYAQFQSETPKNSNVWFLLLMGI